MKTDASVNNNIPRNFRKILAPGQKKILNLMALIGFVVQACFILVVFNVKKEGQFTEAITYGESVASGIKISLQEPQAVTLFLKDLYLQYQDNFLNDFDSFAARIMNHNEIISSLYYAPRGVITHAYPESVRRDTIGFDMLKDPQQAERAMMALDTKEITVAGPHALVEGGSGFIIRNPVFVDGTFCGFTIVILDWQKFIEKTVAQVGSSSNTYKFAVWKTGDRFAVTDKNGFIFGNTTDNISRRVDIRIKIPNDVWHLTVEPQEGWISLVNMIPEIILTSLVLALILSLTALRMWETSRKFQRAERDELTGLFTRQAFYRHAAERIRLNPNVEYNVMVADIENFKLVNTTNGAALADELLKYLAEKYTQIDPGFIYARYGGDSFIVLAPASDEKLHISVEEANRIILKDAPIKNININYGIYSHVDHSLPMNTICDRALIAAKSIRQNFDKTVAYYEGPVSRKHLQEQVMEAAFEDALNGREFKVWYQPKFDAKTEKLAGAEALVRWIQNDGTIISPNSFIPLYEKDGLIVRLDEYIFRQVCHDINEIKSKGIVPFPISVNLSRTTLNHAGTVELYSRIVREENIPFELIPIELTESATTDKVQIEKLTKELKDAGFIMHMDDFGSGFSSLESLNTLPFDVVKLDKSLIDYIGNPGGDEILRHTIELAHFKKMHVVAEGVEEKLQLDFLRHLNCDLIQGYYFSEPKPYLKFIEYINGLTQEN